MKQNKLLQVYHIRRLKERNLLLIVLMKKGGGWSRNTNCFTKYQRGENQQNEQIYDDRKSFIKSLIKFKNEK